MSITFPKGNWASHTTVYRRFAKRSREYAVHKVVHVDDEASTINSLWLDRFVAALSSTQAPIPNRKAPTRGTDVPSATLAPAKNGWDFLVAIDKGSSSFPDFVVKSEWRRTGKVWNVLGGTSMASPAVSGMAGLLFQKLVSSGILIEDDDASKQSESFKKLRKILVKSAVGYEQGWFRRKLRIPEQDVLPDETHIETGNLNWIQSSEEVLRRLENPDTNAVDRMTAVLFAETTAFESRDVSRLLTVLAAFITKNRFSSDEKTMTAVGSAIRKYAMNMAEDLFEAYANWLLPTSTEALGHQLELELIKAFNWRLAYSQIALTGVSENVLCNLADVCSSYLHRRVILQKNFASTVLHGLSAVAILEAISGERQRTDLLFKAATDLQLKWFSELLCDRLSETTDSINEHSPDLAARISKNTSAYLSEHEGSGNARVDTVG